MVVSIYALAKLGAVAALINNNLRGMSFVRMPCPNPIELTPLS